MAATSRSLPATTQPTFTSMDEGGEPDVAPELWVNAVRTALDKADFRRPPDRGSAASQRRWCRRLVDSEVPRRCSSGHQDRPGRVEAPGALPRPGKDSSRGRRLQIARRAGTAEISTANLYKALGAEKLGFTLVDTRSAAGPDGSIANAFEKEDRLARLLLGSDRDPRQIRLPVRLSFNVPHDKKEWDACTAIQDCANPKVNSIRFPTSTLS